MSKPKITDMKRLIIFLIILSISSCKKTNHTESNQKDSDKTHFDWLVGSWIRMNDEDSKKTYESWRKKSSSEYLGVSYTLLNKDTVWKENVKLSKSNNIWSFAVKGMEDKNPTVFTLSKMDSLSFAFENKNNSFPKLIEYKKNGDKFKAVVSGDDMVIPFEFEREKNVK